MGALAEMERELIGERTAAALAHKKANGERLGATPLGFRTASPGGDLEPDPNELVSVERVLTLWRRGMSYRRIASTLNAERCKTKRGGRWHASTVVKIVRRRARYANVLEAV
jgi:DNA invertase Pin-like site-specific DNA recombinase